MKMQLSRQAGFFGRRQTRIRMVAVGVLLIMVGMVGAVSAQGRGRGTVVIDPGHGGHDIGAQGPDGTMEKDVNLALARMVAERLKENGFQALLTRTGDYGLDVFQRTAKANRARGDMFVSIHVGGGFSFKKGGVDIFYIGQTIDTGDAVAGLSETPPEIAWNAVNDRHLTANQRAANIIQRELADFSGQPSLVHEARLAVLEGADMPAVLIEVGSLANPEDEKYLQSPDILAAVADRLCNGVTHFLDKGRDRTHDSF